MTRSALTALLVAVVSGGPAFAQQATAPSSASEQLSDFAKSILTPDLYDDERDSELQARPEIFLQTRFSRGHVKGAEPEDAVQNFEMTRIRSGMGRTTPHRVGVGLELQFHRRSKAPPRSWSTTRSSSSTSHRA